MFVIEKPPIAILLLLSALAPAALSLVSLLRQDEAWRKVSIGISLFGVGSLAAAILAAFVSALDAGALPSEIVRGWILPRQEEMRSLSVCWSIRWAFPSLSIPASYSRCFCWLNCDRKELIGATREPWWQRASP